MAVSLDEIRIFAKAGKGGNGSSSFLRERFRPMGGPNGGNGGKGGDVILQVSQGINTLVSFKYKRIFHAENGKNGSSENKHGKNGSNTIIKVPMGTQVFNPETNKIIADLVSEGQQFVLVKGGKGGLGNSTYKTATNQAPRKAGQGKDGEEGLFLLSVASVGDVGIVGLPNSGKSSLLGEVTAAKAKVGDYPFTTIEPQLGFAEVENFDGFTIVDTPGITLGASKGVGMGKKFLKHIQRCKALIHMIDASSKNPIQDYQTIREELTSCSKPLGEKVAFVVLNKSDSVTPAKLKKISKELQQITNMPTYVISTKTRDGLKELMLEIFRYVSSNKQ